MLVSRRRLERLIALGCRETGEGAEARRRLRLLAVADLGLVAVVVVERVGMLAYPIRAVIIIRYVRSREIAAEWRPPVRECGREGDSSAREEMRRAAVAMLCDVGLGASWWGAER